MPLPLAEFLYSAILWGSLVSWLLWKALRRWRNTWCYLILGGPFLWLSLHTAIAWYGFFFPPMGRVLDDSPDRPMKGERVVATWITYPMGIWTSYCSGRQIHLTDDEGKFSFRFAPWPTLLYGTLLRGVSARAPGRIGKSSLTFIWIWPHGDRVMRRYSLAESAVETGPNTECRVDIAPQHQPNLAPIPMERPSFLRLYEELCVYRFPWAANGTFIRDIRQWQRPIGPTRPFSQELAESYQQISGHFKPIAIPPEWHDDFCAHFRDDYDDLLRKFPAQP